MQVNNSTSPKFGALYIIKGTANKVDKASTLIRRACNNEYVHEILNFEALAAGNKYEYPQKVLKNFTDCAYHYLTGVYGALQPLVQNLIATNDDAGIIVDFLFNTVDEKVANASTVEDMKALLLDTMDEEEANIKAFEYADEQCKAGNAAPLADFVVKSQIDAKKTLDDILQQSDISVDDIRVLRANEVLEAIENKQFDYITGKYASEYIAD